MEVEVEWIGQEAECPACQQVIVIQPPQRVVHPTNRPVVSTQNEEQKSTTAPMVLGIVSCVMWLLPVVGGPIAIIGLILSIMKKYTTGLILNIVGLVLTAINATAGAMLFS